MFLTYSWLSLSRPRLSRITAYLEVIIWSLLKHETLTTGYKIVWKRGEIFSSFPQYFQYISNFRSQITYTFVKCGCSIHFFLKSANLICRCTDILKYFRESLGIRDNESRLYFKKVIIIWYFTQETKFCKVLSWFNVKPFVIVTYVLTVVLYSFI